MKILAQIFISITNNGMLIHALGIAHDGQHPDWIRQYERCLGLDQLAPLVTELEQRGFKKQPSTGYLLIYSQFSDDTALPERVK